MDNSYSSSFESEDEAQTEKKRSENKTSTSVKKEIDSNSPRSSPTKRLDLTALSEELQAVSNSQPFTGTRTNAPEEIKAPKDDNCTASASKINHISNVDKRKFERNRPAQPTTICYKRNVPTFKGSSSINRRKKQQQIERDNMVRSRSK